MLPRLLKSRRILLLAGFLFTIAGAVTYVINRDYDLRLTAMKPADATLAQGPHHSSINGLRDEKPFEPVCRFWEPWHALVKPDQPHRYLETINYLLTGAAARTESYQQLIMKDPGMLGALRGSAEHICIAGYFDEKNEYLLDANTETACQKKTEQFFEQVLELRVDPVKDGGFFNQVDFKVDLGKVTAKNFRDFWRGQIDLFRVGYRGWTQAYPNFFQANQSGFGLVSLEKDAAGAMVVRMDWLTQAMLGHWPEWANFLLKLGDIADIEMWAEDAHKERLLTTFIDTRRASLRLGVPQHADRYFTGEHEIPVVLGHNITVRFRGLRITIQNLKFQGILKSTDQELAFDGAFAGVDKIEIDGSYRGMGLAGMGKFIHNLVDETIKREILRLSRSAKGDPAKLRLGIHPSEHGGQLEIKLDFEAAINLLNVLREEKDRVDGSIMPNPQSIKHLNSWAQSTFQSILKDLELAHCSF